MKTVAVVPVNDLRRAKSRLSGELLPLERASLVLDMLDRVIEALRFSGAVSNIAVITPEPDQLHLSHVTILQQQRDGLNNLLEQGREWAIQQDADALLVTFADLPLVTSGDVAAIAELGKTDNALVLAPDRRGEGTNMMLAHPPSLAYFAFGEGSFALHRAWAAQSGANLKVYSALHTGLDVDTPEDLELMESERLAAWGLGV